MLLGERWYFANETDNYTGTPAAAFGTSVTPGTSNADGTSVTLLSALGHDVHYLVVGLSGFLVSTAAHYCLLDILQDPTGGTTWASLADDLVCGYTNAAGTAPAVATLWYHFPVFIKSGTSLGSRARTSHTSTVAGKVSIFAYGNPSRPDAWWCGQGIETLGVTAASSIGTSITPGNTGTYGSWTNIGGTSNARYGAVQWGLNGTDATAANNGYYFQIGYGSNILPGASTGYSVITTIEQSAFLRPDGPIWCDIASGTQFQMRGTANGTAEIWAGGAAIYGVY